MGAGDENSGWSGGSLVEEGGGVGMCVCVCGGGSL